MYVQNTYLVQISGSLAEKLELAANTYWQIFTNTDMWHYPLFLLRMPQNRYFHRDFKIIWHYNYNFSINQYNTLWERKVDQFIIVGFIYYYIFLHLKYEYNWLLINMCDFILIPLFRYLEETIKYKGGGGCWLCIMYFTEWSICQEVL